MGGVARRKTALNLGLWRLCCWGSTLYYRTLHGVYNLGATDNLTSVVLA